MSNLAKTLCTPDPPPPPHGQPITDIYLNLNGSPSISAYQWLILFQNLSVAPPISQPTSGCLLCLNLSMAAPSVSACQWLPFSFSLSMISGSSYISAYQQLFLSLSLSMAPHLSQSIKVSSLSWVAPLPRPISGSSFILALTLLYNFSVAPPLSGPISPSVVPPLSAYQGLFLILGGSFTPAYQWLFSYLSADSSIQLLSSLSLYFRSDHVAAILLAHSDTVNNCIVFPSGVPCFPCSGL